MADIIKIFHEYGELCKDDIKSSYNQIFTKKVDKVIALELNNYETTYLQDLNAIKNRLVLRVISSNAGNIYPTLFISDIEKTLKGIKKAISNMKKYLSSEKIKEIDSLKINFEKIEILIENIIEKKDKKDNYYLALSLDNKFFNEIYSEVFDKYIDTLGSKDSFDGYCYIDNSNKIGFDVGLNFCSTNELPAPIAKNTKYRLLPLSNESGKSVKLGFEKFFNKASSFRFKLLSMNYILLPTILSNDIDVKKAIYKEIEENKQNSKLEESLKYRLDLDEELELLMEDLELKNLQNNLLFTMLFFEENNKEIVVKQSIEDIAPTKIGQIAQGLKDSNIDCKASSKYTKNSIKNLDTNLNNIYIRDYIDDSLYLAKLLFGKEKIGIDKFLKYLSNKIIFGNNRDKERREFSKIISDYYNDYSNNFDKHQRLIDFLYRFNILEKNLNLGGDMIREFDSIEELIEYRFANSDLLQNSKNSKCYIIGVLNKLVINWQKQENKGTSSKGTSSLENYINSIGLVTNSNIDRVFDKTTRGARVYQYKSSKYEYILKIYSEIKLDTKDEVTSKESVNTLFTLGSVDVSKIKKEDKKDGKTE